MLGPATVEAPARVFRVARKRYPLAYSEITPEDAASTESAGNRYDVPGGGVLYCAAEVATCMAETLAWFRPSPRMRELLKDESFRDGFMVCGSIPQDWRLERSIFTLELTDALPFVDVELPATLTHLDSELASTLASLGYEECLDVLDVRNRNRKLSRAIAEWAYVAQDEAGQPLYSGLRYNSRLGTADECWAVLEGTQVSIVSEESIGSDHPDIRRLAEAWDILVR